MKQSNESHGLIALDLAQLEEITGGEVESIWPDVCRKMSDDGEWAEPGYGDLGQFL